MKLRFSLLMLTLLLASFSVAFGQSAFPSTTTQKFFHKITSTAPEVFTEASALEQIIQTFGAEWKPDTIVVPVVFHVFPGVDGMPSVTEEDIAFQINQLNRLFNDLQIPLETDAQLNASGYKELATIPGIFFCTPLYDPNGLPTKGIVSTSSSQTWPVMSDSLKQTEFGGSSPWDPTRYLNIWVAQQDDGSTGYAQMPFGNKSTDGIVINPSFFGRYKVEDETTATYQHGNMLAHLVGSYLGLYELWNEQDFCADDFVWDTPIHNAPNARPSKFKHVSTCDGYPLEMTMNIMDMGPDANRYMFTLGQVIRMNAVLSPKGPRFGLRETPTACDTIGGKERSQTASLLNRLTIYPSPTVSELNVEIESMGDSVSDIAIFSANGK